jgi:hypothetical protein
MASTFARFESSEFLPVGHLKALVYGAPVDTQETLHRIVDAVRVSANIPASLNGCGGPWWDVSRRALNLVEAILSTNWMFWDICWYTYIVLFSYVELVPKFVGTFQLDLYIYTKQWWNRNWQRKPEVLSEIKRPIIIFSTINPRQTTSGIRGEKSSANKLPELWHGLCHNQLTTDAYGS